MNALGSYVFYLLFFFCGSFIVDLFQVRNVLALKHLAGKV